MGKLVTTAVSRNKAKKQYTAKQYIDWYIKDLEEFYPEITKDMKEYKAQISKLGDVASAELSLAIMKHCAWRTENNKLRDMLTSRYVGSAAATILKNNNAKSIFDLINFLENLKADNERFFDMKIDYEKFSKAMAETKDLKYNRYWIESFDEYDDNYELLINSNDPESAVFLARTLQLSKEDFKKCEEVVLEAKNPILSEEFSELKGANTSKHRKVVINSKNSLVNSAYLTDKRCTVKQVAEHKAAIYTSNDENKLKAIVIAFCEKPEYFSENEVADIVKNVIKSKNIAFAKLLLTSETISVKDKAKLEQILINHKEKIIAKSEGKVLIKKIDKKDEKKKENKPSKSADKGKKDDKKIDNKSSEEIDEEDRLMQLKTEELISFMEQSKRESRKKAQDDIHQM